MTNDAVTDETEKWMFSALSNERINVKISLIRGMPYLANLRP